MTEHVTDTNPAGDSQDSPEVEAILANLQREIRAHRLALGQLGALDQPDPLGPIRQTKWVNPHLPIGWPVMPRGIVAKLVAIVKKVVRRLLCWYINPIVDQQNTYNGAVADLLETLHKQTQRIAVLEEHAQKLATLEARVAPVEGIEIHLNELHGAWEDGRRDVMARGETQAQINETMRLRLQRLEHWARADREATASISQPAGDPAPGATAPAIDYYALGARYRNEAQMAANLADYDTILAGLAERQQGGDLAGLPVLDIGAGRGEFVAHMRELGIEAYGIDIDADAVAMGRQAGRDVRPEDAFTHLDKLPDGSLAAITMIQVVEHFNIETLLRLIERCHVKLAPSGLLIAETINPTCLYALSNWYLLDPSHRTPLHPEMARFLLEQAGYGDIETHMLHPVPDAARDPSTSSNPMLYGPQDYAIVAIAKSLAIEPEVS